MTLSSDKQWERFGRRCPSFGVYSDDRLREGRVDEKDLEDFFRSGEEWVSTVFETIEAHLLRPFRPGSSLDFGCGVGRIVIPLSARSGEVYGVDVSPPMLEEARKNLLARSIGNVRLLESDDGLTRLGERKFDFVHSGRKFGDSMAQMNLYRPERLFGILSRIGVDGFHVRMTDHSGYHGIVLSFRKGDPAG